MSSKRNQRYFPRKKTPNPEVVPSSRQSNSNSNSGLKSPEKKKFFAKSRGVPPAHKSSANVGTNANTAGINIHKLFQRYDQLWDSYLKSRGKYFELFDRADHKQKSKLQQNFYQSLEELRKFEDSLSPWQHDRFAQRFKKYQEDLIYSQNLLELVGEKSLPGPAEIKTGDDPHITVGQKNRPRYHDDQEESIGTIADYQRLKGIDPSSI